MKCEKGVAIGSMAKKHQVNSDRFPVIRPLSLAEIERGIQKLRRRIAEVESLRTEQVHWRDAKVKNVERNIRDTILEIFGPDSPEYDDYEYFCIWHGGYAAGLPDSAYQNQFENGIPQAITVLQGLIERLEERRADLEYATIAPGSPGQHVSSRDVFIVHGHDEASKEAVARFLQRLDLDPIILHEQPNAGLTIIEKFETCALNVGFAVVFLTADDVGASREKPGDLFPRARQNVIFEMGYFVGRLGRSRVCVLYQEGVELPSDVEGLLYVRWDGKGAWRLELAREIKASGMDVDLNRAVG